MRKLLADTSISNNPKIFRRIKKSRMEIHHSLSSGKRNNGVINLVFIQI